MKRYRPVGFQFDFRPVTLGDTIHDSWEEKVKQQHRKNREGTIVSYQEEFGLKNIDHKLQNVMDIGSFPMSIISYHNKFLTQARNSFIIGSYYPALTAICTLTERILNHLIFELREDYNKTKEYKTVRNKTSITNWTLLIEILNSWKVLLPNTLEYILKLKELRHNYAVHFNRETDDNDRALALDAILNIQKFIEIQFSAYANNMQPWYISGTIGEYFIKKEFESVPFIKKFYLPNCIYVGPKHKITSIQPWTFSDVEYPENQISDEEFTRQLSLR